MPRKKAKPDIVRCPHCNLRKPRYLPDRKTCRECFERAAVRELRLRANVKLPGE